MPFTGTISAFCCCVAAVTSINLINALPRGQSINRDPSKPALVVILLACLALIGGCSDPDANAANYAGQAEIELDQKRIPNAREAIRKAILARDDVADYHLLRGRIEYTAESYESAYSAYSDALSLNPTSQEALQAVSQIGLRVGRYNESLEATDKLLVLNPGHTEALLIRGLHELIKRNYSAAMTNADQILAISRLNDGGVVLKARASFLSGRPEEAISLLNDFEKFRPNTPAVSLTRLEIYRTLRDTEQMKKQFRDLTKSRPDDLALRLDEANFLYKIGSNTEATNLVAAVMANKAASRVNVSSAVKLWDEYSVTQVPADVAKSISYSGTSAARIAGTRHFSDNGNLATSAILLGRMAGPDAEAERANIALLRGDTIRAQSLTETILAGDETHCNALKTQATLMRMNGRYTDALREAQKASSECPDQPALWKLTARLYDIIGDQTNVRRVFRQGIQANKQSQPIARAYSKWLMAHGYTQEAVTVARKITRSAPALTSGWLLYAEVCMKTQSNCAADAKQGHLDSQTRYGIDLLPGELPPNGLFGRFMIP